MPTRRDICHNFVDSGAMFLYVCAFLLLVYSFLLPTAFFLRLGAQGHNVMKPVSQGTLNVRFGRIRIRLWAHFGCTFVDFSGFVILLKLCSRVGGSTFLRVWVGPGLVFLHMGRL